MRHFTSVLVGVVMLAGAVRAQGPGYAIPSVPPPRDPLPRFTIAPRGAPLGPVGLPLPQHGLLPPPIAERPYQHRRGAAFYPWPMVVYYVPEPVVEPIRAAEPPAKPLDPLPGRLVLSVQPENAQVFADGYYIGSPRDFSLEQGGGLLDAGVHRIDVSAEGYEPIAVDLRLTSGQTATYNARLKALPAPALAPPTTFYLIPGCYMGNIPPKEARLPATCDPSRAVTWRP